MIHSAEKIRGFSIHATDGNLGTVSEFWFDESDARIRYLVVDTAHWLTGRKVLIATSALGKPDMEKEMFPINLTQEEIRNSPGLGTDQSISRQYETELHLYYGWDPYWPMGTIGPVLPGYFEVDKRKDESAEAPKKEQEPAIRSTHEVAGYHIHATDGSIGHVADFLFDDEDWSIRYLVADTKNWLPGRKVIVSPDWITNISWVDQVVEINLTREQIRHSPQYDPEKPVERDYEEKIHDHYGKPGYWE